MFLKNALWNASGNFVRQVAGAVQEFGSRLLLPPALFGVWEFANLIRRVGNILDLGFLSAAQRDLPVLRGTGQIQEESEYRSTTFLTHLASKIVIAAGVLAYALLFGDRYSGVERAAFVVAAVMLILFAITEALATFYQSAERYAVLSRVTMLASVILSGGVLAATFVWGIWGLLGANLIGLAIYAALLMRPLKAQGLAIKRSWRPDLFRRLAGFALPLKAADYPLGLVGELDMLIVTRFAGLGPLAIYATAKTLFNQAVQVTSWLALVLITRINNLGAIPTNRKQLAAETGRYLQVMDLVLLPVLICGISVAAPPMIQRFLPAYADAGKLLKIMLLTMYFVPQTTIVRNFWILDKRIWPIAGSNLAGLAATSLAIGSGVLFSGFTLTVVATGYLFGHIAYYAWVIASVGREELGGRGAMRTGAHALLSCAYTASVIALMPARPAGLPTFQMIAAIALDVALAGLLLSPLVGYGIWRSRLMSYVVSTWRSAGSALGSTESYVRGVSHVLGEQREV